MLPWHRASAGWERGKQLWLLGGGGAGEGGAGQEAAWGSASVFHLFLFFSHPLVIQITIWEGECLLEEVAWERQLRVELP